MKGGLAQAIFALATLRGLGLEPALTPVVLVSATRRSAAASLGAPHAPGWPAAPTRALVLEPSLGTVAPLKTRARPWGRSR